MKAFTPSVFLKDGDDLTEYGIEAKVIGLSGHTKGSIGVDVDGKELIVGDALMNMFYPTVSMLYNDEKTMLDSVKKITGLGERIINFGHGKPVQNKTWVKKVYIMSPKLQVLMTTLLGFLFCIFREKIKRV